MRGLSSASHGWHTGGRDADGVTSWLKAFVVVAVTLPIAAYVVATLGSSPAQPTPQSPVVLRDPPPKPAPQQPQPSRAEPSQDDRDDDAGDDDGGPGDDRTEGDDVSVVTPSPKRVGDDDGSDDDGGSDDGDDTSRGGDT